MICSCIYSSSLHHYSRYSIHSSFNDMRSSLRDYLMSGKDIGLLHGVKNGDLTIIYYNINDVLDGNVPELGRISFDDIPGVTDFVNSIYKEANN